MGRFTLSRWFNGIGPEKQPEAAKEPSPEAAARLAAAVDSAPIVLFEFDPDGNYICVGGGLIPVFGIRAEQVIGRSVFEFPKFVPGKNMMVRRALAGESVTLNGLWHRGRFAMRLEPRRDADGKLLGVVGLGHEVRRSKASDSDFEQLLEALRESEARFRAMCEDAPLGIYVSDARLELGYVNRSLCNLLGRRAEELLGRQWIAVLHADDRQRVLAARSDEDFRTLSEVRNLRLMRSDGSTLWVAQRLAPMREDGQLIGFVGTLIDITQERASRLAMERAQHDLHRVIECSPDGLAVVREERWIFVNRALSHALGHAPVPLIGSEVANLMHADDRARVRALLREPPSDRATELRWMRANGDYAWMEVRVAPLTEFDGAPALLLSAHDVTERKRLHAQLLLSERLVSMGTLAAGVAHEINNPIAALLSNLDWVAAQLHGLSERLCHATAAELPRVALKSELGRIAKPLDDARDVAGRVRAIAKDLKLFSRVEEDAQGPVDLVPVLDSAVRMAWHELRHRARLVRDYGELPLVHGSDARLGQVFLNLLVNAAQAIPEGCAEAHEISVRAYAADGCVVVEVRDTGSGITADVLAHIFDPFFTTKPAGVGSGLGLSICQRLVSVMGGQIEVESAPGQGSTFRVKLRRSESPLTAAPVKADRISVSGLDHVRGRVLIIDDDPSMATALELALADEHDVTAITSARRALARLQGGEHFDAIVCDVMMPEMSGMDFHCELSRFSPRFAQRVIFLTGGAFTPSAREFLQRVENPCLDKPFESQRLRALVRRQISRQAQPA